MLHSLRKGVACQSGASAVEFAIIAPVAILILLSSIQFLFIFYTFNTAQQAGWLVSRQVATGTVLASNAVSLARSQLPPWAQTAATIAPVSLNNGTYTVTIKIPLSSASPINVVPVYLATTSMTTNATFLSEVN